MFFKNAMRPAMAGAHGQPDTKWSKKLSSMMFSNGAAESDDFGAFTDEPERQSAPSPKSGGNRKKGGSGLNKKAIIIAAAAAVALIILVVTLAVALLSGSGDIKLENNAYMLYQQSDGKYRILANGELLEETFTGETEMRVAKDNSFAFVIHYSDETEIYILEGKKLTMAINYAEEVKATADLAKSFVFTESDNTGTYYVLYNNGRKRTISNDSHDPSDFVISADGQTVVFTEVDKDGERLPYVFENRTSKLLTKNKCTPVAVSPNGDYVYVSYVDSEGNTTLRVGDRKDNWQLVSRSAGFLKIVEMNKKGDEVIFVTAQTADSLADVIDGNLISTTSYLFKYNKNKEKSTNLKLGEGTFTSAKIDPDVAVYKTFADKHFESTTLLGDESVCYVTSKFEKVPISTTGGVFDPKGEYLYCIVDGALVRYNAKEPNKYIEIDEGVTKFEVTEKGNVYYISRGLHFYKASTDIADQVSSTREIEDISFYRGSNKLYFKEAQDTTVKTSEEGGDSDPAKFGSTILTSIPYFSNQRDGKCYAAVQDEDGSYSVFYTSNGNKFKLLKDVDCTSIENGIYIPEDTEW